MNTFGFTLLVWLGSFVAGLLGSLTGLGGGVVIVPLLTLVFGVNVRYAVGASIGVTAAASAGVYLRRGYIDPGLAMPVMLGVLLGALSGARLLAGAPVRALRRLFAFVVLALAIEMIYNGLAGRL